MLKSCRVRFACLMVLLGCVLAAAGASAAQDSILDSNERGYVAADSRVLIGIVAGNEPYTFFDQGTLRGLSVDVLREIENRTGLQFEFRAGNWSEVFRSFRDGELDAIAEISFTEERTAFTLFSEPYHLRETVLFENSDRPLARYGGFDSLAGQRIGIVRDIYYRDLLAQRGNVELVEYHNYADLLKSLAFGWLDGVVTGDLNGQYLAREHRLPNLRIAGPLGISGLEAEDYRIGVRMDRPLLHRIITKGLAAIPQAELDRIVERWQVYGGRDRPVARALVLDESERSFVRAHPVLKAGILQDYEPFSFVHGAAVHGYSVDLLAAIADQIGIRFEPVTGTWSHLLDAFRRGDLDVIANISHNVEREAYTLFTRDYYRIPNVVFVREDFGAYEDLLSLRGKRVGIVRGVFYADVLERALEQELIAFDAQDEMMRALSFGRIDAVATALNTGSTHVRRLGLMNVEIAGELTLDGIDFEDLRFGVSPRLQVLHGLMEKGFDALPVEQTVALQNRWLSARARQPVRELVQFAPEERSYLDRKGALRFCARPDWMPYESIDGGVHSGMASDLLALLAQRGEVRFELVPTRSWAESLATARRGGCDLLVTAVYAPTESDQLALTTPYLHVPGVVATAIDTPFFEDFGAISRHPLGILEGDEHAEDLRARYPDVNLVPARNVIDGVRRVQDGSLFGFLGAMANLSHQLQRNGIADIKIGGRLPEDWPLSIAVRRDEPELVAIMQRLVDSLGDEELGRIEDRWLAMRVEQRADHSALWKAFAVFLLVVTGVVYWNRKLQRLNLQLAEANSRLHELSIHDDLTGLHNRAYLTRRLAEVTALCQRNRLPLAVAMIDIDHFKMLNDTHGHLIGDRCLRECAKLLNDHFQRGSDVVARFGGEEFTVVMSGLDASGLTEYLERMCRRVAEHEIAGDALPDIRITVSIGACCAIPEEGEDGSGFLSVADEALYEAKAAGRNRMVLRGVRGTLIERGASESGQRTPLQ